MPHLMDYGAIHVPSVEYPVEGVSTAPNLVSGSKPPPAVIHKPPRSSVASLIGFPLPVYDHVH